MSTPYYADESVTLWHGDSLTVLRDMPDASVDCCVTSPPYFGLRDYGEAGQYGLEASPAEYVETMRALFAEVRRVLADDGTLWLNLGDSYASSTSNNGGYSEKSTIRGGRGPSPTEKGRLANESGTRRALHTGVAPKNILGIPWRVAFALQDDGWTLRNSIIWHKPNAMPESVTDRLSTRHENVFMFSKSRRYWFDLDAVREAGVKYPAGVVDPSSPARGVSDFDAASGFNGGGHKGGYRGTHEAGRNPGDVWSIPTQPFAEAHFAVYPLALPERCVLAGCKPGGTVLDPFSGSGTTGMAAAKHGRRYVGIDLSSDYLDLSLRTRLAQTAMFDGEASA